MSDSHWSVVTREGLLVGGKSSCETVVSRILFDSTNHLREAFQQILLKAWESGSSNCCIKVGNSLYQAKLLRLGNPGFIAIKVKSKRPGDRDVFQRDLFSSRQWLLQEDGTISELLSCSLSISFPSEPTFIEIGKKIANL